MANGVQEYVEGFVYRGRPPGSDQPGAWHLEIGRYVDIEGVGRTMLPPLTLTPEQAKADGRKLPDVLAALSVEAAVERDAALAVVQSLTAERDALAAERDALAVRLAEGAAPAPAPDQAVITDYQFFMALAAAGEITKAEALAAVKVGALPGKIQDAIEELPEAQRWPAEMLISGAKTFERNHPMVTMLGTILGKDGAALDALWASAGALLLEGVNEP